MPRLTEKDKEALCASEKDSFDKEICKKEYDYYSDYIDSKNAGKFSGDFNDYKTSIGLGVITWGSKPNSSPKVVTITPQPQKNKKKMIIALGVTFGIVAITVTYVIYKAVKKHSK